MVPCLAMSTVLRLFSPTNRSFYNLFNETSGITLQMSELLYKAVLTGSTNESKNYFHRIATLRDKSSELRKKIYGVASRSLIAPFDRSDMLTLSTAIHTVGKSVDTAAKRINLYQLDHMQPAIRELSGLIVEAGTELDTSVRSLRNLQADAIAKCCNKIKEAEHYANQVYNTALAKAIVETDPITFIKYSDILSALEKTTDRCSESTGILKSILIKNS